MPRLTVVTSLLLLSIANTAQAKSVVGFAVTGSTSHQAAVAQVGLELVQRGHEFAMVLSSGDTLSQARLARQPYAALKLYTFAGPPEIGNIDWLLQLDRAPQKVRLATPLAIFRCFARTARRAPADLAAGMLLWDHRNSCG